MSRIEMKDLNRAVRTLNEVANRPLSAWADGKGQIGNYHVHAAYGKYGLHSICNELGGTHGVIGLTTKRELYNCIRAMIAGVLIGKSMESA